MVISIPHYTNLTSLSLENILYLLQHWYAQQLTTNWYSNIFEYIYIWLAWSNNKEVNCGVESPLRSNYQFRARLLLLDIGSDKTIPTTSCEFINIWDTDNILFTTYEYFNNIYIYFANVWNHHTHFFSTVHLDLDSLCICDRRKDRINSRAESKTMWEPMQMT